MGIGLPAARQIACRAQPSIMGDALAFQEGFRRAGLISTMAAMTTPIQAPLFYGWKVAWSAFVIAILGWGLGFYGPSVYLKAVQDRMGWSVALVSAAVTFHFLVGAVAVANLPKLHRRFGLPTVTFGSAVVLAWGVVGWSVCQTPAQLFGAALLSGAGWVALGGVGINAMVTPWFNQLRPRALALAYNGASIGGVVFSPLWVALIGAMGFVWSAWGVGLATVVVVGWLAATVLSQTPQGRGLAVDGAVATQRPAKPEATTAAVSKPWQDAAFLSIVAGMALGLFAQVGMIAHLYSLLTPALGAQAAGFAAGLATAAAIVGRTATGWAIGPGTDRRLMAALSYGIQIVGCLCFAGMAAGSASKLLLVLGVVLFGFGIGNATSMPPLMAQLEFSPADAARFIALITASAQATYAFAPLVFGLIRAATEQAGQGMSPAVFVMAAVLQALAAAAYLYGRGRYLQR